MAEWTIEPLDRSHERGEFSCGSASLDDFLHTLVSQYEKRRLGRTFVAVKPGEKRVLGYHTLAAGAVALEDFPPKAAKKLPKHPVPVILIARLAVDQSMLGKGLGGALLHDALQRCLDLSQQLGVHAVKVDAIDEAAKAFYIKYGFLPLLDRPLHLYLPISTIAASTPRL